MKKLLICVQFWPGDAEAAYRFTRLIADIERQHCAKADLMFCGRFDVKLDPAQVVYASRKFDIVTFLSRRKSAVGWPHGCNELWFDTLTFIAERVLHGIWPEDRYKAILTLESDDCPLTPDWIDQLSVEWGRQTEGRKVSIMGALQIFPGEHINGNAMFPAERWFFEWIIKQRGCSPAGGWDFLLAHHFKRLGWAPTAKIVSFWQMKTVPPGLLEKLEAGGAVLLHGCKDRSAHDEIRQRLVSSRTR